MPQRFLRPGIRTSERWNSVSRDAQALYIAILTLVDDFGRYDGRPAVLHGDAFSVWNEKNPEHAVNQQRTAALCCELHKGGLVLFYEVSGKKCLQVTQWEERIRDGAKEKWPKPAESTLPQESAAFRCVPLPPSSPSPSSSPSVPTPSSAPSAVDCGLMKARLGTAFKRKAGSAWTYIEEHELCEIVKREDVLQELELLMKFKRDDPQYFPQSISALLNNWQSTIDRARNKVTPADAARIASEQVHIRRINQI